jgi:hypothetical protein
VCVNPTQVGSFSPGALLLDALQLFDAQDAHADENLRLIGQCDSPLALPYPRNPDADAWCRCSGVGGGWAGASLNPWSPQLATHRSPWRGLRVCVAGDSLAQAVEECITAASQEFDITLQRSFLRAAAYGRTFLPSFPPDLLADACRTLRVLNAVRAVRR